MMDSEEKSKGDQPASKLIATSSNVASGQRDDTGNGADMNKSANMANLALSGDSNSPNSKAMPFRQRTVGKSKFANYMGTEISDENSREQRRITEEEQRRITEEELRFNAKQDLEMFIPPTRMETSKMLPKPKRSVRQFKDSVLSTEMAGCSCIDVLIADDNEFNLVTFQAMLEMQGLESKGASNGLEAVNKV